MRKVILTTGGTGGHIFPALAVGQAIISRNPDTEILFMGSKYGPEATLAAKAGLEFIGLPARGFLGRGLRAVPACFRLSWSIAKAMGKIARFKPDVVAGFGGYASLAPVFSAALQRVPILLHEQNAIAGAGNHFLSKMAECVCVSLPGTRGFDKKCVLTGNPVRKEIVNGSKRKDFGKTSRLLILGGSQGAHGINEFVASIASALKNANIEIWHQCGQRDYENVCDAYANAQFLEAKITPFIDDMAMAYEWADLAFCRAGASTLAELCVTGTPSVLVPFPAAIHDHQTINATALVNKGAAILVPEKDLDRETTTHILLDIIKKPDRLKDMSLAAKTCGKPDAAFLLADEMEKIANKKKRNEQ